MINLTKVRKYFYLVIYRYDIHWETVIGTAGDSIRMECKGNTKISTVNKPLTWQYTSLGDPPVKKAILRLHTLSHFDEYWPEFQTDDSLLFETLHASNRGVYKCYVDYKLGMGKIYD